MQQAVTRVPRGIMSFPGMEIGAGVRNRTSV